MHILPLQKSAKPVPSCTPKRSARHLPKKNVRTNLHKAAEQDCSKKKLGLEVPVGDSSMVLVPILVIILKILFYAIERIWFNSFIPFLFSVVFLFNI
jgi:hypothetical protein